MEGELALEGKKRLKTVLAVWESGVSKVGRAIGHELTAVTLDDLGFFDGLSG